MEEQFEQINRGSGFYKLDGENHLHAPNYVYAPDFSLKREEKDNYTYPVNGWFWSESDPDYVA